MEKDEIGFDLALISKFVTKKKKFAVNSLHSFVLQFRLLIAFINKLVY
jgi:hypothetical protein